MQLKAPKIRWEYLFGFTLLALSVAIVFLQFDKPSSTPGSISSIPAALSDSTANTIKISGTVTGVSTTACPDMRIYISPLSIQNAAGQLEVTSPIDALPMVSSEGKFTAQIPKDGSIEIAAISTAGASDEAGTRLSLCAMAVYPDKVVAPVSLTLASTTITTLVTSGAISSQAANGVQTTLPFKILEQYLAPSYAQGTLSDTFLSPSFQALFNTSVSELLPSGSQSY